MFIQLNEDRAISSDRYQYILNKFVHTKHNSGEMSSKWEPYLYFATLEGAFKAVPEQLLKESDAIGWAECQRLLSDTRDRITEVFGELNE